jgi:hypothetical protein
MASTAHSKSISKEEIDKILADLKDGLDKLNKLQEEIPKEFKRYSKKCRDIATLAGEINALFGEKR